MNRKSVTPHSTKYTGVCKRGNRFQAYHKIGRKMVNLGAYATAEEAARVRDTAVRKIAGGFLNPTLPGGDPAEVRLLPRTSRHKGVSFMHNRWVVRRVVDGKIKCLGSYLIEDEAARVSSAFGRQ
jgi:hypothetical protein